MKIIITENAVIKNLKYFLKIPNYIILQTGQSNAVGYGGEFDASNDLDSSDERILGDSEFVESLLSKADEKYERRYLLKRRGYNLDTIARRVADIYEMKPNEIFSKAKQQQKVQAKSLFCFWAVKELGISLRELAITLEMSSPGVGYSVERREVIAYENRYRLLD